MLVQLAKRLNVSSLTPVMAVNRERLGFTRTFLCFVHASIPWMSNKEGPLLTRAISAPNSERLICPTIRRSTRLASPSAHAAQTKRILLPAAFATNLIFCGMGSMAADITRGTATTPAHSGTEAIDSNKSRLNFAIPPVPPNASVIRAKALNIRG